MSEFFRLLVSPSEWFSVFNAINTIYLVGAIAITGGLVAMLIDWRLGLLAQLLQYFLVGVLMAREVWPPLAMVKMLAGCLACFVLYWTGRSIEHRSRQQGLVLRSLLLPEDEAHPMGMAFRLVALASWSLALAALVNYVRLPELSPAVNNAASWLIGMGLLGIILTRDPFRTGLGLLTIGNGSEIIYLLYDPGLLVLGLLGIATILTALVVAYLTVVRHTIMLAPPASAPPDPGSPEALALAVEALAATPRPKDKTAPSDVPEEAIAV